MCCECLVATKSLEPESLHCHPHSHPLTIDSLIYAICLTHTFCMYHFVSRDYSLTTLQPIILILSTSTIIYPLAAECENNNKIGDYLECPCFFFTCFTTLCWLRRYCTCEVILGREGGNLMAMDTVRVMSTRWFCVGAHRPDALPNVCEHYSNIFPSTTSEHKRVTVFCCFML